MLRAVFGDVARVELTGHGAAAGDRKHAGEGHGQRDVEQDPDGRVAHGDLTLPARDDGEVDRDD